MVTYEEMAHHYRRSHPDRAVCYLIFFHDQLLCWQKYLSPANDQPPGSVAVHHTGLIFQACGGNDFSGAEHWEGINAWDS